MPPIYPYECPNGHKFERMRPWTDSVATSQCSECGEIAKQDYAAKHLQVGMVDGPHEGYYHDALGFPKSETNPLKRICPSKNAFKEATKRAEEATRGEVGRAD